MQTYRRPRGWLAAAVLVVVMAGSGSLAGPVAAANGDRLSPGPWLDLASRATDLMPWLGNVAEAVTGPSSVSYNGKLTFLLVGSDWRGDGTGERLDTIMVITIAPSTKKVYAVSIPRDTGYIPIPRQYGGGTFKAKINGMFKFYKRQTGTREGALARFKVTIEQLLAIKIDYVAYTRFNGFDRLVDEVSGVPTDIAREIRDPKYIDKPGWPTGARFVADGAGTTRLRGADAERCYGGYPKPVKDWTTVKPCYRALVYVRSRKGTIVNGGANNDYKRAARQQTFVFDAIKRVTDGYGSSKASSLRDAAYSMPSDFYISPSVSATDALALYNLLDGAQWGGGAVLAPKTYASHVAGTSKNRLKLDVVRSLCNSWFDDA